MATPAQAPQVHHDSWGSYVESITRATTALLVLMYGLGFLILSVYEARYGIMQFNPLRTRTFLVGFVFIALAALPTGGPPKRLLLGWGFFFGLAYDTRKGD